MHVNRHIYWLLTENSGILPKKKVINNYYDRVCVFVFKWNELHSTMRKLHGRHIFFKVLTKLHLWKNNIRKTFSIQNKINNWNIGDSRYFWRSESL